jgi:hypothetical protein
MSAVRRKTTTIGKARKAAGTRRTRSNRPTNLTNEDIAVRAYYIWQSKGCPWGQPLENWLEAEKQVKL